MSGWRDTDGRTSNERRKQTQAHERLRFLDRVRQRPLSLVKPLLFALFIGVLIAAFLLR